MEEILHELRCPITLELFEEPITVPCCGKAFSRAALIECFKTQKRCPLCNKNLEDYNPAIAAKNVILSSMIESLKEKPTRMGQRWAGMITPMEDKNGEEMSIAELKITLENSEFRTRPSLFIAVVDRSGSMAGSPWKQVESALIHIMGMTRSNSLIETVIIAYASYAEIINTIGTQNEVIKTIRTMYTGGGTNFNSAYEKIKEVISKYTSDTEKKQGKEVSEVTIAFLTDGEASGNRNKLVGDLKEILEEEWEGIINVHTIGFGRRCDRKFLEELRKIGSIEGTFRYAEPQDDEDTLCQKLQVLFDKVSESSSVNINVRASNIKFIEQGPEAKEINIQFPVNRNKRGVLRQWIEYNKCDVGVLILNSCKDEDRVIEVRINKKKKNMQAAYERWMNVLIDRVASEVLELCEKTTRGRVEELYNSLIEQKIEAIEGCLKDEGSKERLEFISEQRAEAWKRGTLLNIGKLSDSRFGSKYNVQPNYIKQKPRTSTQISKSILIPNKKISLKARWERGVKYARNNNGMNRNKLQEAIINNTINTCTYEIRRELDNSRLGDMKDTDKNGNTALMLAAYCGQSEVVSEILKKYPQINLEEENDDGETAMTLAIKKRGYWKVIKELIKAGGKVQRERRKGLEEYAINNDYTVTGKLLANMDASDNAKRVNERMNEEYVRFLYETAMENGIEIETESYLETSLSKGMQDMVRRLLEQHKAKPTIEMLLKYCIPKKPDSRDTPKYIKLAEMLLNNKELINETDENGDSPLLKASEKGSLEHVKLFIDRGCEIDKENKLGNTPLWIACAKRYPCIITELLNRGAEINHINLKGNPPISSICQMGPKKIAEMLLSRGAKVDQINANGDTLILLCCRNGKHDILELLLNYVDEEFVNHKAHIDGFNAILASTEANKPQCIKILHEYGIDIEQKTEEDNNILAGATSLHLAAYYGRKEAARELLLLGATPNSLDMNGQTPLHIAVIQGNISIIKLLRNNGADIMKKDSYGNTPSAYCRNKDEIRRVLINPALDILMSLGEFNREEEIEACDILLIHSGARGCLTRKEAVDIRDGDGTTPLVEAIIHSKYETIRTLLQLGADPNIRNKYNMNGHVWARWIGNPRIKKLLEKIPDLHAEETNESIKRLETAQRVSANDAMILFISNNVKTERMRSSGIKRRMEEYINVQVNGSQYKSIEAGNQSLVEIITKKVPVEYNSVIQSAKVFTISMIASGNTKLTPKDIFTLCTYTNNEIISRMASETLINNEGSKDMKGYIEYLCNALETLSVYEREVYVGATDVDRTRYRVGNKVQWPVFRSSSAMWRVATQVVPEFTTKKREGTVFIIHSKSGRYVGQYSQFSYDAEVIFRPKTEFIVKNWYIGDVIALGQANIREKTFKIKEDEYERMERSNKSMIIELEEI